MKRYFMYIQWFYWIQVFYLNYNYHYSCHLKQWRSYLGIIINQWSLRFFSYLFCIRRWIKWCVKSPVKVWDTKCSKHPCDTKRNANFLHFNFYCRLADYVSSSMKKNGITVYQCESTPWGTYIHLMMPSNNICVRCEKMQILVKR